MDITETLVSNIYRLQYITLTDLQQQLKKSNEFTKVIFSLCLLQLTDNKKVCHLCKVFDVLKM